MSVGHQQDHANQVQRITGTAYATALDLASTLGAIFATVGGVKGAS